MKQLSLLKVVGLAICFVILTVSRESQGTSIIVIRSSDHVILAADSKAILDGVQ